MHRAPYSVNRDRPENPLTLAHPRPPFQRFQPRRCRNRSAVRPGLLPPSIRTLDPMLRDLRYAARSLRRDLAATVFSIAIAGLGIGASTTVFGLCQALLLRPLPFREPERLVWIANGSSENLSSQTTQVSNFQSLVEQNRSFEGVAGFNAFYGPGDIRLGGTTDPERITGVPVTQSFFPLLGVSAAYGRFFDDAENRFGGPRAAVLDRMLPRVGRSEAVDARGTPRSIVHMLARTPQPFRPQN